MLAVELARKHRPYIFDTSLCQFRWWNYYIYPCVHCKGFWMLDTVANQERWAPNYFLGDDSLIHDWHSGCIRKSGFENISSFDTSWIGALLLQLFRSEGADEVQADRVFYSVCPFYAACDGEIEMFFMNPSLISLQSQCSHGPQFSQQFKWTSKKNYRRTGNCKQGFERPLR